MLRPRESRDLRLISSELIVMPEAVVTWAHDVFGNSVATATFAGATDHLAVDSVTRLELDATAWPVFEVAASAASLSLSVLIRRPGRSWRSRDPAISRSDQPAARLGRGLRPQPSDRHTLATQGLERGYHRVGPLPGPEDEGTQSPIETLDCGQGSCRDFAVLFVEAVRNLGFGARIVSGYLYNPERDGIQHDACLGGSLRAGRRLDHLRSDKSFGRRLQPDSRSRSDAAFTR